jgi:WD40 repeat protein
MCTECERACDDSVVQQGGAASDYAAELVRLAKELCAGQVHAAVAITRTTKLEHRIKALFDRTISHSPLNLISRVGTLIAVVALVLLTTTMRPGSRSVAADEPGKGNQASAPAANSTAADKPTSMLTSPNPLVRILQPVPKDVRVDRSGDPIPDGMVQRLGGTRFKVPGWWREFAFAANDEWIWLKAQYAISVIHRETGRSVNQQQLRLGNGRASHLSVSGDGRRVAIDMSDDLRPDTDNQLRHRVVIISTLTTSHLQEVIWKSPRTLSSIGLSHDGQLLLTASSGDLCLWNVETGEPLYREAIQGFGDTSSAAIVRDGKSAIVVGQDFVAIWNFEQNPAITKLPVDQGTSICLARNDRMFATLGHDEVRVWDITNCNLLASLKNDQKRRFMGDFGFSFSPDSKLLAVPVASDHAIELWNVELTECVNRFHVRRPRGAIFSRNGRWLAAAGDDSVTTIIDLQTGKQVNQPSIGHEDTLWSLCFIDDESLLSSCVDARIWDLKSATQQKVLAHNVDTHLQKVAVSPDGRRLVTIGHDSIGIWDSTTGARLLTIPTGFYNTRLAQFNADGSQFVTWGGDEARLRWWNTADGTNTATFEVDLPGYQRERKPGQMPRGHIFVQALTPEKLFVVYGENLLEFDVITGEQRRKVRLDHRVWALAASTDGRWLAMAEEGRLDGGQFCVVLRDLQKLEIVRQWPVAEPGEIPSPKNEDSNVPAISRVMQGTQGIMFSSDSKHLAWCRSGHRFGIDVANIDQDSLVAKIPLERFHGRASALCVDLVI